MTIAIVNNLDQSDYVYYSKTSARKLRALYNRQKKNNAAVTNDR